MRKAVAAAIVHSLGPAFASPAANAGRHHANSLILPLARVRPCSGGRPDGQRCVAASRVPAIAAGGGVFAKNQRPVTPQRYSYRPAISRYPLRDRQPRLRPLSCDCAQRELLDHRVSRYIWSKLDLSRLGFTASRRSYSCRIGARCATATVTEHVRRLSDCPCQPSPANPADALLLTLGRMSDESKPNGRGSRSRRQRESPSM